MSECLSGWIQPGCSHRLIYERVTPTETPMHTFLSKSRFSLTLYFYLLKATLRSALGFGLEPKPRCQKLTHGLVCDYSAFQ